MDSNKNKIPDYYDPDRLNKYAANHGGIVVDIRQEVTAENMFYPYSSLEYPKVSACSDTKDPIQITETTTSSMWPRTGTTTGQGRVWRHTR